jgi:hypothetical protein
MLTNALDLAQDFVSICGESLALVNGIVLATRVVYVEGIW